MLNKDELLRRTNNGLDVFKHYISTQWKTGRNFLNPLYEDRKASCNVYFDRRNGVYKIKEDNITEEEIDKILKNRKPEEVAKMLKHEVASGRDGIVDLVAQATSSSL